jgi:hypothetical protein
MKKLFYIFLIILGLICGLSSHYEINLIDKLSKVAKWEEHDEEEIQPR